MAIIDRTGAESLIPITYTHEIMDGLTQRDTTYGSVVLKLARRLANMTSRQHRLPVISMLPIAYWQDGTNFDAKDIAAKKLTTARSSYMTAEEIAVIVLVSENTLNDADYDLWNYIKPLIIQSIGGKIDEAVLLGTGAPVGAPAGVIPSAISTGNVIIRGDNPEMDGYAELLGEGGLESLIEEDGYYPSGYVGKIKARPYLRDIRSATGDPIYRSNAGLQNGTSYQLDGSPIYFPNNGVLDGSDTLLLGGDFNQLVYSIREDISMKLLDQSTVVDSSTNTTYHLAQQDMVGLRVKMRLAWATPNPINRVNEDDATRYPFAVLKEAEETPGS
ncbi:phage capsid protein [Clostridia bacterium]|nr:phage capsid protein [Clostridia bacterium]